MKNVFAETFSSGTVKTQVVSVTLANNTLKSEVLTVPDDTIWIIELIKATNPDDVARAVTISLYLEVALTNHLGILCTASVNAGSRLQYPSVTGSQNMSASGVATDLVLNSGMTIQITWAAGGASSGGTDADGLTILYRELNKT